VLSPPVGWQLELTLALFQAVVTLGMAGVFAVLAVTHRKRHFAIWAAAWSVYVVRLAFIALFLVTRRETWLFLHQVATGLTALLLLWAALTFAWQLRWRPVYYLALAVPVVWSYVAVYLVTDFMRAAVPSVVFLSLVTLGTGVVFAVYSHRARSPCAAVVAAAFLLWSIHHMDYVVLRARGAWVPYGYYLDIFLEIGVATGMIMLVLEDVHRGLAALAAISSDLQKSLRTEDVKRAVLERPLALPAVVGCALFRPEAPEGPSVFQGGSGVCAGCDRCSIDEARRRCPHAVALPIYMGEQEAGTLLLVSRIRDPFAALDESFHRALGQQIGAALQHGDLYQALEDRSAELRRASASLLRAEEAERRRIARELHDDAGQVLTAIRLELGLLSGMVPQTPHAREAVDRALHLTARALETVRRTARGLRPAVLDDLGLVPAIEALAEDFSGRTGVAVDLVAERPSRDVPSEVEVALYRVFQEALTNVARHAEAGRVLASLGQDGHEVVLVVEDDGRGFDPAKMPAVGDHPAGLAGMRERLLGLGGHLDVRSAPGQGTRLEARMPLEAASGG